MSVKIITATGEDLTKGYDVFVPLSDLRNFEIAMRSQGFIVKEVV